MNSDKILSIFLWILIGKAPAERMLLKVRGTWISERLLYIICRAMPCFWHCNQKWAIVSGTAQVWHMLLLYISNRNMCEQTPTCPSRNLLNTHSIDLGEKLNQGLKVSLSMYSLRNEPFWVNRTLAFQYLVQYSWNLVLRTVMSSSFSNLIKVDLSLECAPLASKSATSLYLIPPWDLTHLNFNILTCFFFKFSVDLIN